VGERPDQHHTGDGHARPIPEAKCGAGEQVQRMPERGPLRRRPNQQFPIDRDRTVHAPPVQPLRVRARTPRNRRRTVDSGCPNRAAMKRCPAPRACAIRAFPIALVLSARRTGQRGREQDLGDLVVRAAGSPPTHWRPVSQPALRRRRSETETEFRDPLKIPSGAITIKAAMA